MSSPFEGLEDSWQDRQERDRRAARLRRRVIYRIAALVCGSVVGAGLGSVIDSGDFDSAGRRFAGAAVFGIGMGGMLFLAVVRRIVRTQMFGHESAADNGWLLECTPVAGAVIGGPYGSVFMLPVGAQLVGLTGARVGAVAGAVLVWGVWRLCVGRTRY